MTSRSETLITSNWKSYKCPGSPRKYRNFPVKVATMLYRGQEGQMKVKQGGGAGILGSSACLKPCISRSSPLQFGGVICSAKSCRNFVVDSSLPAESRSRLICPHTCRNFPSLKPIRVETFTPPKTEIALIAVPRTRTYLLWNFDGCAPIEQTLAPTGSCL